jgi:cytochrome c553
MEVVPMSTKRLCFSVNSLILLTIISNNAHTADIEAGRIKATQCAICHGIDGEGNGIPQAKISGMDVETFKQHIHDFQSGARKNVMMQRFVEKLSEQDIENLAAYFASK